MNELFAIPWIRWSIIAVVVMVGLWIIFSFARKGASTSSKEKLNQSEMRELEQRYTEGSISKEEFDRRKQELTRNPT